MEYLMARRTLVEDRLEEVVERVEPRELSEQLAHTALSGGETGPADRRHARL